jgi:hypothetical protein
MTIINEPRYQDFNGNIYRTEKQCITAENDFVEHVFQMFEQLVKGCKNQNDCNTCPFNDKLYAICTIKEKIGRVPEDWNIKEEE